MMNRLLAFGSGAVLLLAFATIAQPPAPPTFQIPEKLLFSYGTWQDKAIIQNQTIDLAAPGMTPKGGAGWNFAEKNIDSEAESCLAVTLKVGAKNSLKTLRIMLTDANKNQGVWNYTLPKDAGRVTLIPSEAAPLREPNTLETGSALDLKKIMQLQVMGDWGGDGPVNVAVEKISFLAPNDPIRTARAEREKRRAEEVAKAQQNRLAQRKNFRAAQPESPVVQEVYAAAPDLLALSIQAGKLGKCELADYKPLPGDKTKVEGHTTRLIRDGQEIGYLLGAKLDSLMKYETYSGHPLLLAEADDAANFRISSPDDPAFAQPSSLKTVWRKSKAEDWQQPIQTGIVVRHRIYLKLPQALVPGKTYTIRTGELNTDKSEFTLKFQPEIVRSESVHVQQIGFRPDDGRKRGYLSLWTGNGGNYDFAKETKFHLLDDATNKPVFSGTIGPAWPATETEGLVEPKNRNGTAVAPFDFSAYHSPGRYRVMVDGVGCSFPFTIGDKVWETAFQIQMKGFFHQRSGIDLGPPYTTFIRPACLRAGVNGAIAPTQSTYSAVDPKGSLREGDTKVPVPEAWGGYHDAGDWNPRRITHMMTTTFWQLELLELAPDYFKTLSLQIPNDAPGPDLLKECLFELSLFRRLQLPDGSCRFGIETDGDPAIGEVSWKSTMPQFVYAPDLLSSYCYAAVAARAAGVLATYDPKESAVYRKSAIKAMRFAEADRLKRLGDKTWAKLPEWSGAPGDLRARAAACLFSLTRDAEWETIFRDESGLNGRNPPIYRGNLAGRDAAFTYARLPNEIGSDELKRKARAAILADADAALKFRDSNAFGIVADDPGKPHFIGYYSTPHGGVCLARAHHLTREAKYLSGAVGACEFAGGANPNNIVYTSGLGANPVQHALCLDALATGQPPPIGLTPYGNIDLARWNEQWISWPFQWFLGKSCQPDVYSWPTTEAYFDVRAMPAFNEFCIDQTMGFNAYVWGYLAARK